MNQMSNAIYFKTQARLAIIQRSAFSVVGPSAWNDLPFELRSLLMSHPSNFYISLRSFSLIYSFIHIEHLYSTSSRELLRGAPDRSTAKKSSLKVRKKRRSQGFRENQKF